MLHEITLETDKSHFPKFGEMQRLKAYSYFGLGTDSALWHESWNGNAWSSYESLGGVFTSNIAVTSW